MPGNNNTVLLLMGPTAVGKTSAGVKLARRLDTEIISADSMQIYKHMNIGTAKPSEAERRGVPHHMLDIVEPSETFSAGRYIEMALPVIKRLLKKGKLPIVAGGTGLYTRCMTQGLFDAPEADWTLRASLLEQEKSNPGSLYGTLSKLDPTRAAEIEPGDTRRIVRALEVCLKSGSSFTEAKQSTTALNFDFIKLCLLRQREELYEIIDNRVDWMFDNGLVDEVRLWLLNNPSPIARQAIGYKEVAAYLEGQYGLPECLRLVKRNSRRYAKRQLTWFRAEPDMLYIDISGLFSIDDVFLSVWERLSGLLSD